MMSMSTAIDYDEIKFKLKLLQGVVCLLCARSSCGDTDPLSEGQSSAVDRLQGPYLA